MRKHTTPVHKTRIHYSEDDLALFACPTGDFRFEHIPVHGLPPADLAPPRTPPPGRTLKRNRSDSTSPNATDKKRGKIVEETPVDVMAATKEAVTEANGQQSSEDLN